MLKIVLLFGLLVSSIAIADETVNGETKSAASVTDKELLAACDANGDSVLKGRDETKCKIRFGIEADKKEIEAIKKETEKLKEIKKLLTEK